MDLANHPLILSNNKNTKFENIQYEKVWSQLL
jgi:hypothetical protein